MESQFRERQAQLLTDCILKSIDRTDFSWEVFFKLWFRQHGVPLFFLFKKNLSVTNTQYVELFSLIMRHCSKEINGNSDTKLLFHSTEHIKTTFTEAVISLLEDFEPENLSKIYNFSAQYVDIFSATIAVDMFFGSCAVFIPNGIDVDLEKIVYDSGYIHSAGKSIFIRNIKKAKKSDFISSLDDHLRDNVYNDQIPFIVYSHEDFSGYDIDSRDLIDKGIEQCKIYVEKMSMGSYRLSSVISEMQNSNKYDSKLLFPKAGNYLKEHLFRKGNTIWLISDRSISGGVIKNPGNNRYYICYAQSLKNDSPFYFFDENKPAWKSHTTLPHSLTAALINAARPIQKDGAICDPFSGTGTTWLEVKRLQLENKMACSDLSPATNLLLLDNMHFFTRSSIELKKLKSVLETCQQKKSSEGQYKLSFGDILPDREPYDCAMLILNNLKTEQKEEDQEFDLSRSLVNELMRLPFITRFVFYICLRAELRFQSGFTRKSLTFDNAFKKSLDKLIEQINMLIELKSDIELQLDSGDAVVRDSYIKSVSTYSHSLTPKLVSDGKTDYTKIVNSESMSSLDACCLIENSNDLIICDPPYGFNTTEDTRALAKLYSDFIDKAILSLRPRGQLILCLPGESYTGRDLPYCTRSDLISRQIIVKAHQQGRLVFKPAQSLPIDSLSPPYYWESERALRRTILHFYFL